MPYRERAYTRVSSFQSVLLNASVLRVFDVQLPCGTPRAILDTLR